MSTIPYLEFQETDFQYRMRSGHKGIAIIINNERFDSELNVVDRIDSRSEAENLYSALRYVGFREILRPENLTGREIFELLKKVVDIDYRNRRMDCFFLAVLSYGDDDHVYATDIRVSHKMLLEPLRALSHLPKIVIVQANPAETPPCKSLLELEQQMETDLLKDDAIEWFYDSIPPQMNPIRRQSDIVFVQSLLRGSQFGQALCNVLRRDGRKLEIMQLLTRATRMMSYGPYDDPTICHPNKDLPIPHVFSVLTKDLYFY